MQLTKQTDYAFRVLIYLGSQTEGKLATIQAISESFDISKSHVMKIVQKLVNHGFIESVRGPSGGIRLGKNKKDINLREIIELMEVTLNPVNCDVPMCRINNSCELKKFLHQAQAKYLEHVEQFTLEDIISTPIRNDIFIEIK